MNDSAQLKHLSKVREAREYLLGKTKEIYEKHLDLYDKAMDLGELEVAMKTLQWLSDHMPADHDGLRAIDPSVDNTKKVEGQKGPNIQIGIALGTGNAAKKSLPPSSVKVIDVSPIED